MVDFTRRYFMASAGAITVTGCATQPPSAARAQAAATATDFAPVPNAAFRNWITAFRPRALNAGISAATFDRSFARAGYLPDVIARDRNQIQTRRTFEDYLSIAASDERVAKGRAAFAQYGTTLRAIEARYKVDARIIAAIWGLESQFGEKRGTVPVISATATLAFDGRRERFYTSQLIAALQILERGDTTAAQLTGSWAGAMGHTQFIPTSYQSFAVDFDGDGRRDIWTDDPTDALASTASYLARNGWQSGLAWGAEAGTGGPAGRTIQPQAGGVRFTVTSNFDALKTYNNSDFYAIGIGHLADRIGGAGPLQGRFPPDPNGLTKDDRITIQRALVARGYDVGTIDGVIGAKSEAAIRDLQTRQGMRVDGIASRALLARLR